MGNHSLFVTGMSLWRYLRYLSTLVGPEIILSKVELLDYDGTEVSKSTIRPPDPTCDSGPVALSSFNVDADGLVDVAVLDSGSCGNWVLHGVSGGPSVPVSWSSLGLRSTTLWTSRRWPSFSLNIMGRCLLYWANRTGSRSDWSHPSTHAGACHGGQ